MKVRAVAERHAAGRPVPRRNGDVSDWRLYGRLLGYIVPYWYIFLFSLLASVYPALRLRRLQPVEAMRAA